VQVVVGRQWEGESEVKSVCIPPRERKEGKQNAHFFAALWMSATPTASIAASISFGVDLLPVVTSWRPKSSATAVVPSRPRRVLRCRKDAVSIDMPCPMVFLGLRDRQKVRSG
jgi:hypothetical protein